jgi:transposase-like protein
MTARRFLRDFTALANDGKLWCPECDGIEKQPVHPTDHNAALYRCSCCGKDWTVRDLASAYLVDEHRVLQA